MGCLLMLSETTAVMAKKSKTFLTRVISLLVDNMLALMEPDQAIWESELVCLSVGYMEVMCD